MPIAKGKNRGYHKIKGAADAFNFDFRDKIVLDIGSSTGGFTQYALDHGAKQVIAIEKGTNQMTQPLRFDPRIELHEKTDIFDVSICEEGDGCGGGPQKMHVPILGEESSRQDSRSRTVLLQVPDIIVADVSFISLRPILEHAKHHLTGGNTDFLVMLKPQFEAKPYQLNKGVVKNEKIRRDIIKDFEQWLKNNNFVIVNKRDNQLKGKTGNQERFYWLRKSQ